MEQVAPLIIESDGTRRQGSTKLLTDDWGIEIADKNLRYLRIDNTVGFQIGETLITFESPFDLTLNGKRHECDIDDPKSLVPLLRLAPGTLESAVVDTRATLTLSFLGGARISAASNLHGEAWEIRGPGTFLAICNMNPGMISVWE
jgi:hypothetical protein